MEEVHRPSHRAWIDDNVVNVRVFLEEWTNVLSCTGDKLLESDVLNNEYRDIDKQCGLHTMRCNYQERVEPADKIEIPDDVKLKTLRYQAEELNKRAKDSKYCGSHYVAMKYCSYPPHKILNLDVSSLEFEPVNTPEVLLTVQIYTPERKLDSKVALSYAKLPSFHVDQEFQVLGSQFLTELRDKIDCLSDKAIPGECSDFPDAVPDVTCKDLYKSGFFYINGVFFNDMRDKDCRDYSDPILKWSSTTNRGIGPFKKALMEETRFIDLTIQLGYPYVFVHQGECEHIIVFSDLRLFSEHDVQNRNAYPLYVQVRPSKRVFCMVCHAFTAQWVVFDNKRLPENPFFFCKQCYISFNYDSANQKIGDFRAYHYPDGTKFF